MVGDIYLGTVEAVLPGIQAAFVNIGAEKSAFLHASDLIEAEDEDEASDHDDDNGNGGGSGAGNGGTRSARRRLPNIADELKRGEARIVQIIKRKSGSVRAPALLQRETSLTRGITRDLFSDKVDSLLVDSKVLHTEVVQYLKQIDPDLLDRVKLYQAETALFDEYDIEAEIRSLFKPRVELPTGGYLIIQPTEALTSIDVNTGRYTGKKDPESTILKTNVEAAREVARQLRLRDIGGIIVVDFIDMESRGNRDKVLQELRTHLGRDRARTKAFAVSELGLIEMTRQRVRPSLWQSMTAECPTCTGTGRVFRPEVVVRRMERSLKRAGAEHKERQLAVRLHPEVALYLVEQEPNFLRQLEKQTGLELEVRDDPMMRLDEFRMMAKPAGRDVTEP